MESAREKSTTLRPFVEALRVGDPIGHLNLTLVPLRGEGHQRLDYVLAAEAIEAGTLTVTEIDEAGSVPELLAVTTGEAMVLLLDGEELVGAKQNRILNTTVLLRPKSKTKIPVSCVEQGRWRHTSTEFASGGYSPTGLRARKSRDVSFSLRATGRAEGDQGAVWDDVAENIESLAACSPTAAMHDVVEQRRESLDAYVNALEYPRATRGVVVAINGKFAAADMFDRPETLERVWPRLVTGYALDALSRAGDKPCPFTAKAAEVLLEHVGDIDCDPCPSPGVGKDWRFEAEDIIGQALVTERTCVHLSVFPNDDAQDSQPSNGPRILPPSRRRRRRQGPDETVY